MAKGTPEAVLRPREAGRALQIERREPAEDLSPFVDYLWYVRWDVEEPYRQQVLPQPRVHVAVEHGRLLVYGVSRGTFARVLTGRGHTLGAAFHPGGFRCLQRSSVSTLKDRVLPAYDVLGVDDRGVAAQVCGTTDVEEMASAVEGYLRRVGPEPDPVLADVQALMAIAEHDRAVHRVETLAARASMSVRSVQRLFREYVGIGPKWVIQRFRILEVAGAAHSAGEGDEPVDWADLAARLGFSDQAHLVRVFTQVVGTPPATYAREM